MYQAKESGKDRLELFSDETRARILRRIELEHRLRLALENGELEVHYQPQIDLVSGELVGVEALVRWSEATPAEFIPLAEETGLIGPLGTFVLTTATRAMGALGLPVTVNVSTRQLEDPDFPMIVERAIFDAGIEPRHLCLEITESALMGAPSLVLEQLRLIKERGVYVGTCALYFFIANTAKLPGYYYSGLFAKISPRFSLQFLPLVLAGAALGYAINRRVHDQLFSKLVYLITFFLGWYMLYRGLAGLNHR
jgi:hypothetical protein